MSSSCRPGAGLVAGLLLGGSVRNLARARSAASGFCWPGPICELWDALGRRWAGSRGSGRRVLLMIGFALRNVATTGMVLVAVGCWPT